jgi:hypothetical protein
MPAGITQIDVRTRRHIAAFDLHQTRFETIRTITEEGVCMKRHVILGTVCSAALAVGVFAQEAQPPTAQQDAKSSNAPQTITVTGCLKADAASPSAAPGAPANPASSASAGFILEASASGAAAKPASPTESPSPTATSGSATTYKLSGGSSDLASLVGKKVEVKGTVQKASAAGGAPGAAMGDTKAQQLRVSSVKEVSGSCSQ